MRKVEEKMLRMWRHEITGKASKNTELKYLIVGNMTRFGIFLFGNLIAYKADNRPMYSLSGYGSRTTLSRLRALGLDVRKKNGVVYRDGNPWRGDF